MNVFQKLFKKNEIEVNPIFESPVINRSYNLKRGKSYLIKEDKPNKTFKLFSVLIKSKCQDCKQEKSFSCESLDCTKCTLECPCSNCTMSRPQGLVISRMPTNDIREKYLLQVTPIFWLSKTKGKYNLSPGDLGLIIHSVKQFLQNSKNPIVMLDGVEYLIINNDFLKVLKFIDDLNDAVVIFNGRLLIPISVKTLSEKELALLERNLHAIFIDTEFDENI